MSETISVLNSGLRSAYDELFMTDSEREEIRLPRIYDIPLSQIDDFPDHPFQVRIDEDMSTPRYAKDKPESCKRCSFWNGDRVGCSLGTANCYYLLEGKQTVPEECVNCPYIRDVACVGSCYKRLLPHIWGGAVHAAG